MENVDVLSCIQPKGELHIGNYFGAIKTWVELQQKHNCIYGIVDLHAMTTKYDPAILKKDTDEMIIDILACGIDPNKSTLFVQSLVPEHAELTWILGNVANYGELTRQVQFKDIKEEDSNANVSIGLFTYPVLQAADILIYRAKQVPVGIDQKQGLEFCRDIAERFNNRFGEFFPIPEPRYSGTPKVMSLADPAKKMSKRLGEKHFIKLFESEAIIREKVMSAITDSDIQEEGKMSPGVANLFQLLNASGAIDDYNSLLADFNAGTLKYQQLKETVADTLIAVTKPLCLKRKEISKDTSLINDTIREMSSKARAIAQETLFEVKNRVGIKSTSNF